MNAPITRRSLFRRLGRLLGSYPVGVALARLVGDSLAGLSDPAPAAEGPPSLPPGRTTTVAVVWSDNAAGRQWAEDLRGWLSAGMPVMGSQVGGENHPVRSCYWTHSPEPPR